MSASDRRLLKIQLAIQKLELLIEEQLHPLGNLYPRLQTIPSVSQHIARIITKIGTDNVILFPPRATWPLGWTYELIDN